MSTEAAPVTAESTSSEPRGKWKSGRWWKDPTKRENRITGIIKVKTLKTSWDAKMKAKADQTQFKKQKAEMKERIVEEKKAKIAARKEKEERRKANERKAEVVQVIRNTSKLRRAKKKELRKIEKRDTTNM
uniref:Coiled-coil domain-containing protein 86 n=1 Tax=Panagrellus redivivus TaxID=6233 RepID=A0A7E4VLT8_PANRE